MYGLPLREAEFPFKKSSLGLTTLELELLFIETVERLLVGEAVKDRSGDETVVAVEEVEFIFFIDLGVGIPEGFLYKGAEATTTGEVS